MRINKRNYNFEVLSRTAADKGLSMVSQDVQTKVFIICFVFLNWGLPNLGVWAAPAAPRTLQSVLSKTGGRLEWFLGPRPQKPFPNVIRRRWNWFLGPPEPPPPPKKHTHTHTKHNHRHSPIQPSRVSGEHLCSNRSTPAQVSRSNEAHSIDADPRGAGNKKDDDHDQDRRHFWDDRSWSSGCRGHPHFSAVGRKWG